MEKTAQHQDEPNYQTHGVMTRGQAVFIGVGAMIGAGVFALLGTAGELALSAVWLSFVLAGVIAALQGYSFASPFLHYLS